MGEARRRLDHLFSKRNCWGNRLPILASAAIGAAAARFFGGGVNEIIASAVVGVVVGLLTALASRRASSKRLTDFLAGFVAALGAIAVALAGVPLATQIVTIAGVIILLPGLTITLAMNELATRHLVSGTARLVGALTILISIGLGIAIGRTVADELGRPPAVTPDVLPWWTEIIALAVAPIALTVVFQARRRDVGIVAITALIGFTVARIATAELGTELGVFLAAIGVGVTSNAFARLAKRPSAVAMLPGITLLVPGSLGLRSVDSFLLRDAIVGVETAFTMLIIAAALVAGLLTANVVVPPRRAL